MELSKLSVNEYMDLLGSDAPAPGGGSAAALSGAQGAALGAMVCALTLGREKYADFQIVAEPGMQRMNEAKAAFLTLMQTDTDAYNGFREALAMPKDTEAARATRKKEIEIRTIACILTPLKLMELSVQTLELIQIFIGRTNPNAVSDLGVAALSLKAALHGGWLNVKINLPGLPNEAMAAYFRRQGEELLQKGNALVDEIVAAVENALD